MSFFYGLDFILVTEGDAPTTDSYSIGIDDTTILPGHHFKDGYMTATLALVIVTWISMMLLYRFIFRCKISAPPGRRRHERVAWSRKWDAAYLALPTIIVFLVYLSLDIAIRVCIELRLHVPVGFAAIEIPSNTFLVAADIMLLLLAFSVNKSMIMRLEVDHGFRHTLYAWFVGLSCSIVVLVGIAERVYAINAGVKWGFAWNEPDWIKYALVKVSYCAVYLALALSSLATALTVLVIKNRISRSSSYVDLCGNIPACSLLIITPALVLHSASAFYFAYFYHYQQIPQPPHLELVRVAFVCLPVIAIMIGSWRAKREDVRMMTGAKMPQHDSQAVSMLGGDNLNNGSLPAYDPHGQKVADVAEAPVLMSPRDRMWAPHGQVWNGGSYRYENLSQAPRHDEG